MRALPLVLLWLCIAADGTAGRTAARPADELRAAAAIEDKRRDLGLPASRIRLQPGVCRQEVRCPGGRRAVCIAAGDYTRCERLLGNDGTALGAVCLGHEASAGGDAAGQVRVRQALCPADPR